MHFDNGAIGNNALDTRIYTAQYLGGGRLFMDTTRKSKLVRFVLLILAYATAPIVAQPLPVASRPAFGGGVKQRFIFTFQHPSDIEEFGNLNGLIHQYLDARYGCYFVLNYQVGYVKLVGDGGDAAVLQPGFNLKTGGDPGSFDNLPMTENSQCKILKQDSFLLPRDPHPTTGKYRELAVGLNVEFKPLFTGNKGVWLAAQTTAGENSGWIPRGAAPANIDSSYPKVTMTSWDAATSTFVAEASALNTTLQWRVAMLAREELNGNDSCWIVYVHELSQLWLYQSTDFMGVPVFNGVTVSALGNLATSISSPFCTVQSAGSQVIVLPGTSNGSISLKMRVTFGAGMKDGLFWGAAYNMPRAAQTPPDPVYNSQWQALGPARQPQPVVEIPGGVPVISSPSRLETNLGPLPVDSYHLQNCQPGRTDCTTNVDSRYIPSCSPAISVRQCYQNALAGYKNQGVVGVRFQFALCGGFYSTPIQNCGGANPQVVTTSLWAQNLANFYQDLQNADITYVTPTPVLHGFGGDVGVLGDDESEVQEATACGIGTVRIVWWPASTYPLLKANGFPFGQGDNNAYNCAPSNSPNFVGWDRIFSVFEIAIGAARAKSRIIREFDIANEIALSGFTIQGRLISDNKRTWTDPVTNQTYEFTPVLARVRALLGATDAGRATYSVIPESSSNPSFDCQSIYGDSARLLNLSNLTAAMGGGVFGRATGSVETEALSCGGSTLSMITLQGPPFVEQGVIDLHHGACTRAAGTYDCMAYQSKAQVAADATVEFNAVRNFMASFCAGGWRNPAGSTDRPLCGALYLQGEIPLYEPYNPLMYGANCDGSPLAGPAGTIQGFNSSTLPGHLASKGQVAIFRPWVDPANNRVGSVTCYKHPHPLSQYFQATP